MSSRFMIEMPHRKMTWEAVALIGAGILFMSGPVIALISVARDSRIPVYVTLLLVVSTLFGITCGFMFIRSEVRRQRSRRAEQHLKQALKRMGYVALEPIEVHGSGDLALIKDEQGSALWNVSVSRDKVVCEKRT